MTRYNNSLYILFFLIFSNICPAVTFDESATFKYRSNAAKILWSGDGFLQTLAQTSPLFLNQFTVKDTDTARNIIVALPALQSTTQINLYLIATKGIFDIHTKESSSAQAAQLKLQFKNKKIVLAPYIDTYLIKKNRKALGNKNVLKVGANNHGILSFNLPQEFVGKTISNAELILPITSRQYGHANSTVHQFKLKEQLPIVDKGLSQQHFYDENILAHPSVYYAQNFEQYSWQDRLLLASGIKEQEWQLELIYADQDTAQFIDKKNKYSAKIPFTTKQNLANNLDFYFKENQYEEPEEAYFRYYLKLGKGANISGGGKLPGFGGTYNKAGWGGRGNNGKNGWSARGGFFGSVKNSSSPWQGHMPIGQYVYEVGKSKYGYTIPYGHSLSTIEPEKWYCLEQRLKLNTPGKNDGILEAWINGHKIFSKSNLNFRSTHTLKIEKIWFNFYFGGVAKPKHDFDIFIDNIVIASEYIGPLFKGI